jgi:hypothetical protein
MASNPPARCCTIGVKHEGEAKGEIKSIDNSKLADIALSTDRPR